MFLKTLTFTLTLKGFVILVYKNLFLREIAIFTNFTKVYQEVFSETHNDLLNVVSLPAACSYGFVKPKDCNF